MISQSKVKNYNETKILLEVDGITKEYKEKGFLKKETKKVLNGLSFNIRKGECLGIVGESGSGKSTLGRIITGIEKPTKGSIKFNGEDIYKNKNNMIKENISIVFQNYVASVNPRFTVSEIIKEPLIIKNKMKEKDIENKLIELIKAVGLKEEFLNRYPKELSGGQLQRVCIARAISTRPKFIMLDEAVSSLDVSTQVEILELLKKLKTKYELSYIFVTHDLLTITYICDSVIFFKDGKIEEKIDNIDDLEKVKKDYSKKLLESVIEF
ncbi:MAG: ABC transporter ATP-binding protein [Leptotrichiaceae bacterium]|nr:ABC transporter ATP-binding protein [Leptotrichiaceae bacterium]MBP7100631.1 ABC transporter ATP-binding protein [Leptotrichiaceae bacterium]MBP7725498.1 ABC transporter ATP-binding protein [Leptotrichiaceae bacterium]MBP9630226.1 ABC transporter ATP-binding protein [Leptotrichiaceae bacterium]